jgi:hypothetical protein
MAVCGVGGCPNVLVSSEAPPSWGQEPYSPELLGWITMHELGHALGLGHATNLLESTDLMGYGWPDLGDPVLSDCDVDALAFVFAWALEGVEPYTPGEGPTTARSTEPSGHHHPSCSHGPRRTQVCKVMPDAGPRVTVERFTPSSSLYVRPSEKVWEADGCGLTTAMPAV